jgi:hypothetical protein
MSYLSCVFCCVVEICLIAQPLPTTTPCAVSTSRQECKKEGKNYADAALACSTDSPLGCLLLLRLRKRWKSKIQSGSLSSNLCQLHTIPNLLSTHCVALLLLLLRQLLLLRRAAEAPYTNNCY